MNYKTLKDLPDVNDTPVLVRLDLNAPVQSGVVGDDYRIRKALPTLQFLREKGAKIIIISHIEGGGDTLRPVFDRLAKDIPATFCDDCLEAGASVVQSMKAGDVVLCENIRLYDGEKKNDETFAKKLASLGKIFVNEAFSVSHRKHASIVSVPKFLPSYAGLQFDKEIQNLSVCFAPKHPFVCILGGAKFDTKIPLVNKLLPVADSIVVAGALAHDFFKAQGFNVGVSLVSETPIDVSSYVHNPKITLPTNVVVETVSKEKVVKSASDVKDGERICDAGPKTVEDMTKLVNGAKIILWNGPLGSYEKGDKAATLRIAEAIAKTEAVSIIGGGDTVAAIAELGIEEKFTFVSTGGGAMLDFLAQGTLPGLEALKASK